MSDRDNTGYTDVVRLFNEALESKPGKRSTHYKALFDAEIARYKNMLDAERTRDEPREVPIEYTSAVKAIEFYVTDYRVFDVLRAHINDWLRSRAEPSQLCARTFMDLWIAPDPGEPDEWKLKIPMPISDWTRNHELMQRVWAIQHDTVKSMLAAIDAEFNVPELYENGIYQAIRSARGTERAVEQSLEEYRPAHIENLIKTKAKQNRSMPFFTRETVLQQLFAAAAYKHALNEYNTSIACKNGISYINVQVSSRQRDITYDSDPIEGHAVVLIRDSRNVRPDKRTEYDMEYFDPNGYTPPGDEEYFDYTGLTGILKKFLGEAPLRFTGKLLDVSLPKNSVERSRMREFETTDDGYLGIQSHGKAGLFSKEICALYCTWYIVQRARSTEPIGKFYEFMTSFYDYPDNHYLILGFALEVMKSIKLKSNLFGEQTMWSELLQEFRATPESQLETNSDIATATATAFASDVLNTRPSLVLERMVMPTRATQLLNTMLGPYAERIYQLVDSWERNEPYRPPPEMPEVPLKPRPPPEELPKPEMLLPPVKPRPPPEEPPKPEVLPVFTPQRPPEVSLPVKPRPPPEEQPKPEVLPVFTPQRPPEVPLPAPKPEVLPVFTPQRPPEVPPPPPVFTPQRPPEVTSPAAPEKNNWWMRDESTRPEAVELYRQLAGTLIWDDAQGRYVYK